MRNIALLTTISLMALALASPLGSADHCNGTITDVGGVAYVDSREDFEWIYLEMNGEAGLQSGGASPIFGWSDDCDHANPDLLIY